MEGFAIASPFFLSEKPLLILFATTVDGLSDDQVLFYGSSSSLMSDDFFSSSISAITSQIRTRLGAGTSELLLIGAFEISELLSSAIV